MDSQGSPAVGKYKVNKLIEKHHVALIIGGLFSNEAKSEFLASKRQGVLFLSLSQVYIPIEQKNHLLLEIPGSVESQINQLLSTPFLKRFGNRVAIIYPNSDRGDAFINSFWARSQQKDVQITGVASFIKNQADYRDPVSNILGLKFPRERQEELNLLTTIHDLESKRSARRIQTLTPQIDFDWVFIPALPKDALQIIPSFRYFDAYKIKVVGGPSWRSKLLKRAKFSRLYFVGDEVDQNDLFINNFIKKYKKRPKIIELMGHDAINMAATLLKSADFNTRDEFDMFVRAKETFQGITGYWKLVGRLWLKKMKTFKLTKNKLTPLHL